MDNTEAVAALSGLAQDHRLAIFRLLVRAGPGGMSAGAIATALGMAASSLSFHLAQLGHAGLIGQRRVGRQLFYAADFSRMTALVAYLTENCCGQLTVCAPACDPGAALRQPPPTSVARRRRSSR